MTKTRLYYKHEGVWHSFNPMSNNEGIRLFWTKPYKADEELPRVLFNITNSHPIMWKGLSLNNRG